MWWLLAFVAGVLVSAIKERITHSIRARLLEFSIAAEERVFERRHGYYPARAGAE